MATAVFFHAHPDDEAIATGGTMAKAKAAGHRVVLVLATRGELGEVADGVLDDDEELWERRVRETYDAAAHLGVDRVEFLGYRDSGMMGEPTNDDPTSFWQADVAAAAASLATLLRDERADALVVYDDHGVYGHPDHIQVHRVGVEAARLAGVPRVFESTMNREYLRRVFAELPNVGDDQPRADEFDDSFGSPESVITHAIDVTDFLERKRAAMAAHASQIPPDSFFLTIPPDAFRLGFGVEWYIERNATRRDGAPFRTDLLG